MIKYNIRRRKRKMAEILILMWLTVILVAGSGFILGYMLGNVNGYNRGKVSQAYAEDYVTHLYEIGEEARHGEK